MPKLSDEQLCRQWAIRVMREASKNPELSGLHALALAAVKNEIAVSVELFIEAVSGRKVV